MKPCDLLECAFEQRGLREEDLVRKDLFDKQIFMGAGHPSDPKRNFSGQDVALLHAKVDQVCSLISGLQQAPRPGTDDNFEGYAQELADGEKAIDLAVQDIVRALKGS